MKVNRPKFGNCVILSVPKVDYLRSILIVSPSVRGVKDCGCRLCDIGTRSVLIATIFVFVSRSA